MIAVDDCSARRFESISATKSQGLGLLDENLNGIKDTNEKKVYFEFSDYRTNYIFFESPD